MHRRNTLVYAIVAVTTTIATGCATLTTDSHQPISFLTPGCSSETKLECTASNKRGSWQFMPPTQMGIRRSDDPLRVTCVDAQGQRHDVSVDSEINAKIVASAVFLDLGITDAITDHHRDYPTQIIIPACN